MKYKIIPFSIIVYAYSYLCGYNNRNYNVVFRAMDILERLYRDDDSLKEDIVNISCAAFFISYKYEHEHDDSIYVSDVIRHIGNASINKILGYEIYMLKRLDYRLMFDTYYNHLRTECNTRRDIACLSLLLDKLPLDEWLNKDIDYFIPKLEEVLSRVNDTCKIAISYAFKQTIQTHLPSQYFH